MEMQEHSQQNDAKVENAESKADFMENITGAFGRYQLWLYLLVFLTEFPVAFHQIAIIFLAPRTPFVCNDSNSTVPDLCPCWEPEYDTTVFISTIISEWDLICEDKWLTSFTQTLYQSGTLVGSILFGMASDRYGRKVPLLVTTVLQIAMGIGAAYAPNYWTFTFIRFFVGVSVGGMIVTGFVIVMEFTGTNHRDVVSALYQVPFNMGHMLLPLFGYYFRHYADFQLAISVPTILLLSYFFLLPETPRWLVAVNRTDEAVKILERIAKVNKRSTANIKTDVENYQKMIQKSNLKKGTIVDLFRTPNLRKNIIAMSINWFSASYCFYGVSQYVGQLSGDIFINVAISATVTLVGTLLSIPLLKITGRRYNVIAFNFITAICLIILAVIPEGPGSVAFASIGVVSSFIIFVLVCLYCVELFPTVVRTAAVGFSSMMARVGAMIAPFVLELRGVDLWMAPATFAIVPLIAGCIAFIMPETKGFELMTTIDEGEQFGRKKKTDNRY